MTPKAIIFDWDNTLVQTWGSIHAALKETFEAMGVHPWTLAETKARVSHSLRDSFPVLFGDRWEDARDVFYTAFERTHCENLECVPGAESILQNMASICPVFILSNKRGDLLKKEIDYLGWSKYLQASAGAGDFDVDKPDPSTIPALTGMTCEDLGRDLWIVGDTVSDIALANRAGGTAIWFNPDGLEQKKALGDCSVDHQVTALAELSQIL